MGVFAMADGGLLLIFRGMTTEQLNEIKDTLLEQIQALGNYTSMGVAGKSWTRDLRYAWQQLEALQFVLNERSGGVPGYSGRGVIDFSETGHRGYPPGTEEDLNY